MHGGRNYEVIEFWESYLPVSLESLFSYPALNLKIKVYKSIILPTVLNGSKTWRLTWREIHTLRVFEKVRWGGYLGIRVSSVNKPSYDVDFSNSDSITCVKIQEIISRMWKIILYSVLELR
jgi:hypothetical protein